MIRAEPWAGLTRIWLDRPAKRNALTLPMIAAVRDLLREAAEDPAARGVIVAGAGPSTSAGVDLSEFAGATPETARQLIDALAAACAAARECPKPVAMAIQGHCLGGALELACACDLRVAARGAMLGMPEVAIGLPSVIDAALIARHVGLGRALELVLTGEPVAADTALAWGLVHRVVEPGLLMDACADLVSLVARNDPAAIARQKRLAGDWLDLPLEQSIRRSKEELVESFTTGVPQRLARERLNSRGLRP